jgi:predicted O-linked N-acetylglucosamine transferase (SPINDLY family)
MIEDPMYIAKLHKNINKIYPKVVSNYKESLPTYVKKNENEIINIGFVSGDFICHPVSYFITSILKNIDYTKFNITCYTCKIVQLHDQFPNCKWRVIKGVDDKGLFKIISEDKIDVLFDLSAHTGDNRLDTFVLKPAPIQISFCGYPGSSGIKSMDYHITDKIADSKKSEKYYTEKLLYMPHSFLNYTPTLGLEKLTGLSEQPYTKNKYITFGCFNRFNKVNPMVIKTWEKLLQEIPTARFVIKTKEFSTDSIKKQFLNAFTDQSVLERVEILQYSDTYFEHLNDYNLIDVALDTFPYSGTTN